MRIVVYAEGPSERAGEIALPPAPGQPLTEEHLGPVHVLVRRLLVQERRLPEGAIGFEAPLLVRGREARGSHLYTSTTLRQLLRWARTEKRPDLAIVIVDSKLLERAQREHGKRPQEVRRTIAACCNLDEVAKRCPAFDELRRALRALSP